MPRLAGFGPMLVFMACSHHMSPMHRGEGMHHRFDDPEAWASRFDDPGRDEWQKPDEVVRALGLKPDARVADVGAATGYFSVRLARAVPAGKVYGVDLEASMVAYLERRAHHEGLSNVVGVVGSPTSPNLPEPVDLVLLVDTYHHVQDRTAYFRRLASSLTAHGRIAVIDFRPGQPMGPSDAQKVSEAGVESELREAGFVRVESPVVLPNQYFLVFSRAP